VASEEMLRELEEKYEGYTVYDNRGAKIGKVDDLLIDEADREEYVGVKMGFLGRKSTLIPMDIVRVNEADKALEVSESKDHVKDAPSFDDDEDITLEYENRIRSHFGLESSTDTSRRRGFHAHIRAPETRSAKAIKPTLTGIARPRAAARTADRPPSIPSTASAPAQRPARPGDQPPAPRKALDAGSPPAMKGAAHHRSAVRLRRLRPSRRAVARRSAGASSVRRSSKRTRTLNDTFREGGAFSRWLSMASVHRAGRSLRAPR
jgi:hypothetical protein